VNETQKTPATVPAVQGPLNGLDVPQTLAGKPADAAQEAADAVRCPVCDNWARHLPQGQLTPTHEQRFESCWIRTRSDGQLGDEQPDLICTAELRTKTELTARALASGTSGSREPNLSDLLHFDHIRPILRFCYEHPLTSDAFTLLLMARLDDISVYIANSEDGDHKQDWIEICLEFCGPGTTQAIAARHLDELHALFAGLIGPDQDLYDETWLPENQPGMRWGFGWSTRRKVRRLSLHDNGRCALELPWPPEAAAGTRQGGQG